MESFLGHPLMLVHFLRLLFHNQIAQKKSKDLIIMYLQFTELFINVGTIITMTQKEFK